MYVERRYLIYVHAVGRVGLSGEGPYRLGGRRNPTVGARKLDDERPGGWTLGQVGRLQNAPPARQRRTASEHDSPTKKIPSRELHKTLPGRPSSSWEPDLPRQARAI